eukprot:gnl/Hemi2/15353_TR5169_c0_g1_i1.p1 gnl/Hemi2/15353_TR5169_c0_g1~~gnl/Hemi2/15353_TR5169_c0_g1_i1.p1  ORF type:complete len:487 (-),score=152.55 gnl/Hemi2/15353_TR5169_c0_g1_i1:254-1714(-)
MSRTRAAQQQIQIQRRIAQDRQFASLVAARDADRVALQNAKWEAKTDARVERHNFNKKVEAATSRLRDNLMERRAKLRALLAAELDSYKFELANCEETTEQRRARMLDEARRLHQDGELERTRVAEEKSMQRWREECDELRTHATRVNNISVRNARNDQLSELTDRRNQELDYERKCAEMHFQDYDKKQERFKLEKERAQTMNADMVNALDRQLGEKADQAAQRQAEHEDEKRLLNEMWELDNVMAVRREQARKEKAQIKRAGLDQFNDQQKAIKASEKKVERDFDLALIKEYLEQETRKDAEDADKRRRLREEARTYRAYLVDQMQKDEDFDRRLDRMRQAEADAEYAKQVERWTKEDNARNTLMQEVLADRKAQIVAKADEKKQQKEADRLAHHRMMAQAEFNQQCEREEAEERFRAARENQDALVVQRQIKNTQKQLKQDEKVQERINFERAEQNRKLLLQEELHRNPNASRSFGRKTATWFY